MYTMRSSAVAAFTLLFIISSVLCARTSSDSEYERVKRVISGHDSDHSKTPYMVSMQAKVVTRRFFGIPIAHRRVYCGGTLIADRWVLTAAHCFQNGAGRASDWHARFASPNLKRSDEETFFHVFGKLFGILEWQQMEYHPQQIIVHPQYLNRGTYANDIALVQLKETIPLSLSDRVGLIDLSVSSDSVDPETCSVYGWGCAAVGSAVQSTIQKGNLPLVSDDRCQSIWHVNMEKRVCAGGSSTMSACHGDSGGPLVCQTYNGTSKQIGVISFIHGDSPASYPVVLTEVSAYSQWINNYIN